MCWSDRISAVASAALCAEATGNGAVFVDVVRGGSVDECVDSEVEPRVSRLEELVTEDCCLLLLRPSENTVSS